MKNRMQVDFRVKMALCDLEDLFDEDVKLTFVARNPKDPDAHYAVTHDKLDDVIQALERLKSVVTSDLSTRGQTP